MGKARRRLPGKYVQEEVPSTVGYPADYLCGSYSLRAQAAIFSKVFHLPTPVFEEPPCAPSSPLEHWYLVPRWQAVDRSCGYAADRVIEMIRLGREFENFEMVDADPAHPTFDFRLLASTERTADMLDSLPRDQTGNFIMFRAQFGKKHRGKSPRRVLETLERNEFALDLFSILAMVMLEPGRLDLPTALSPKCLSIECAGTNHPDLAAVNPDDTPRLFPSIQTCEGKGKPMPYRKLQLTLINAKSVTETSSVPTAYVR